MSTQVRQPAERFPIGEYIREEMEARGWSADNMASRMCLVDFDVMLCELELHLGMEDSDASLGEDTARRMGKVLGVEGAWLMRLDALGRGKTPIQEDAKP